MSNAWIDKGVRALKALIRRIAQFLKWKGIHRSWKNLFFKLLSNISKTEGIETPLFRILVTKTMRVKLPSNPICILTCHKNRLDQSFK